MALEGVWSLGVSVHQLDRKVTRTMTAIEDVRNDYRTAFQAVKDQRDAALALAAANADKADASAKALTDALDADAADDLVQLAKQQEDDAKLFADDLAALKDQPEPVEPAPVDETPAPDPVADPQPEPTADPTPEPVTEDQGDAGSSLIPGV